MHTVQAFLTVVFCGFFWLTIILSLALVGEVTIFEKTEDHRMNPGWADLWPGLESERVRLKAQGARVLQTQMYFAPLASLGERPLNPEPETRIMKR